MKITKNYLQKLIKEELIAAIKEQWSVTNVDDRLGPGTGPDGSQRETDNILSMMRQQRDRAAAKREAEKEREKLNPIKKSHRVSGDIGAPTIERAHIVQAIKSVLGAYNAAQKSELGDVYRGELKRILATLRRIESATRAHGDEDAKAHGRWRKRKIQRKSRF